MNLRPLRKLREIDRQLDELTAAERAAEEWARFEIARSATSFSRNTQKVVDNTMSLSATLMRAGEVHEANRLMAEAEREVRTEEAALIETVNEVKAAGEMRRHRMTKLKIAKAIATAFLSAGMFATSAFGFVMARQFTKDDPVVSDPSGTVAGGPGRTVKRHVGKHAIEVAPGIQLRLTSSELKEFEKLTADLDRDGLRKFLARRLPLHLVDEAQTLLLALVADTFGEIDSATAPLASSTGVTSRVARTVKTAPSDKSTSDPSPSSDDPSPSQEPSSEPSPEPSPTDDDKQDDSDGPGNVPLGWPLDDDDDEGGS